MKYSNTVEYNISTKLDASGLTKLQAQIKQLETSMQKMSNKELIDDEKISAAKTQLEGLNSALTKSFNPSLGILDLSKFRLELENSGVSAKGLQSAFSMMGAEGKAALNGLTTQIANFNGGMERTSSAIDKVFTTFSNTFRWGMVSSFFSQFMNAIHNSIDYVKELDNSLTQIMLVTDYNKDSMNEFARSANEAAKAVSMTTTGMTNASLIFAQQGYNLNQSQELATLSAKVANASQQDTATTSDQITAYMNAYGLENSIEELTQAMDNWALIANISAADVGELAQASQRAASMANAVGVSGEQLAAQIATIESVTREAPEQIGNGLKTLYARFSDIAAGKEDEDGFTLGKVTSQLNAIGVQVFDKMGQIRDVGDIMEDLMFIWEDLDQTSKVAASQALAGKYQVNRFMALMDNSDMYEEYKGATGSAATGTLDQMNEEFANSIEGRTAKLQASLEGLFSTIFNTDDIYPWMDAAQGAVDLLQQFFDALGGGKVVLLGITSLLTQAFSQNMARSINDMVANYNLGKTRERNINTVQDTLAAAGIDQTQGVGAYIKSTAKQSKLGALNEAQYDNYMSNVQQWADTSTKLAAAEENLIDNVNAINLVYGKLTNNKNAAVLSDGELDTSLAAMTRQGLSSSQISKSTKEINFSDVADEARNAAIALRDLQSNFDQLYVTSDQLAKPIDEASAALESLTATGGYSSNSVEKIKSELQELRTAVEEGGISSEDARIKIQKYVNEMERLNTIASEMNGKTAEQILSGGGIGAQKAKTDYDLVQIQNKAIAEKALSDQGGIDFQQSIKGVLDMVSAVQQLTFAVEAFHNIGSIWKNEDLSQGEKIVQTIMNLTTVLFNATSGMKNFYDGMKNASGLFSALKKSIIEQAEAIQKKKILEEQAAQAEKDHNIQQLQDAQQKIQAEVNEAEAAKVTADINVLKAETALQTAKANLEEAQASLSSIDADQAKINSIKLIAEAHLAAAQAAIAEAEAEGRAVDPRAEADLLGAKEDLVEIGVKQLALDEKAQAARKAVADANEDVLQKEKELLNTKKEASVAEEKLIEKQNLLTEVTQKLGQALSTTSSALLVAKDGMNLLRAIGIDLSGLIQTLGASISGLGAKIATVAPILLPLMAIGGIAYGMFKDIENQKAENSKNYEEAKAQLEEVKSLTEQANNFQQQYESQKGTEQAFNGLADSAKEYAQSLRDLGEEDRAQQVESAILRAELQNTQESYQNLSNVISETQEKLEDSTYIDMMNKAYAAISNTGESVQFLAKQEQELKDKRAELNDLSENDPYRAQLESEIEELEDFIAKNQEAYDAKEQLMASALDYNLNQASKTNGWQFGILNAPGDRDLRAATMDWQSLNSILEQSVPGFREITDENERLALALAHTTDEAQRAAIQIQQMLNESDNLTEGQKTGITQRLEQSDLTAEQSAQVVAALNIDQKSTYDNILPELQDILQQISEGEDLEVILKAKLDPEELEETIRSQLAAYEPKDKDVEKESFDDLADTFYENKDQMGVEGTPFEDFSEDLFNNAEALEDVIENILRYNDAIESLDKSYDDWKDALENTGELSDAHLTTVRELQETYSDFLGLSRKVSKTFASNTENLELMQKAAEGDTEAFEDLEDAVAADFYMEITGVEDLDVAKQKIEEINSILADSGIEEIPIGEVFNLDDFESVRAALDADIRELGLTAEEASQYASEAWHLDIPPDQFTVIEDDMNAAAASAESTAHQVEGVVEGVTDTVLNNADYSVSTDIDKDTAEATDTVTFTNLKPVPIPATILSEMPVGNGNTGIGEGVHMEPFIARVNGVGYEPDEQTVTQLKTQTGFKEDVKAEQGSGGGHVGLPAGSGAQGSRRPTGGSGRSGASRPSNNTGGGGGSCFVAGTLITTLTGFKPIEEIQKGDIVLSYNERIKINEYSEVLQTMVHDTIEPIYTLYIKDEQLRVTGIHRFLVTNKITCGVPQWVHAADLKVGNWVMFADGTWHVIHKIDINIEHRTVYNFEVSHNHNYYVGRDQILAHNKKGKGSCFVAGTQVSTSLGFKSIENIQPNDVVLSYNEQTGYNEYSSVVQTMIHDTKEFIYTLYIQNEQLRVTGIHRFFITKNILTGTPQWVAAENLKVGDWVLFANGTWHVIWKIEVNIEQQTVYNFEVSGNHNYYVGYNQILAHNKGSNKGKGGGKAKEIKPKEKKEHEKDYYEEVNNQLDKTEKILSKIEKEEDRLIGDKARANQNKQLKLLQKEVVLNKEKLKIQKQELKDVDARIKKQDKLAQKIAQQGGVVNSNIPDVVLDEDGIVQNYEQISKRIDDIHNDLIEKYNAAAAAGNEELTKDIEEQISKFDKYGENLLEAIKRHNKLKTEIEDTTGTLESLDDAIEDIRIDAFKAHQEAIDHLKDLKEDAAELASLFRDINPESFIERWSLDDTPFDAMTQSMYKLNDIYSVTRENANGFYQDLIDQKKKQLKETKDKDERKAIQSSIDYFQNQQANLSSDQLQNGLLGLANQDVEKLQGWINGTNKEPNPFGDNEAALWEAYEEAYERAVGLFKDWRKEVKELRDSIIEAYDEQEEAIERNIDNYDRILDHLERINDTYSLYYGEDSYDAILDIMNQQGATMQQQLANLTTAYNYWAGEYQKAIDNGDEKLIQEIKEKMDNAQDAMYDKAEELAEHWVERYEKAIDASIQKVDIKLWGGGPGQMDLEDQTTIWELQKDYMNTYKDDVEKAYEIDKLRTKYVNLLNDAQGMSLQTQNKIRAQMQEQLDLLANQGTMSEYDVKLANAKLEILQKQIALEDAQRNKNKMQLRRDTQGNYRYVYSADQGDVQQAQDELNESQYDAYEMTKEQTIANNDRAISLYQDYMNKMRDIANKYKDDDVARNAAMKALSEEYSELLKALGEDFKDTTNGMYDVLTWMVENGTQDTATAAIDMLNQLYDENGKVKENTGNDWRDLATQITEDVLPKIDGAVAQEFKAINNEADNLAEKMVGKDGVLNKIGSSAKTLKTSLDGAKDATLGWANATQELFEAFKADSKPLQEAMTQLRNMESQLKENQKATSRISTLYKQANQKLQAKTAEAENYHTQLDYATGKKQVKANDTVTLKKGTFVYYDRSGEKQYDETGQYGWRLPKDMTVKIKEVLNGENKPYAFYLTGQDLKEWGPYDDSNNTDNKNGFAPAKERQHQIWWLNQQELLNAMISAGGSGSVSAKFDTGGYTGDWQENTKLEKNGKLAVLHSKELVLNASDTENILSAIKIMREITVGTTSSLKQVFSKNGLESSYNPVTEQRVEIQASFPNATDAEDIRTALLNLSDKAYQYAHRSI